MNILYGPLFTIICMCHIQGGPKKKPKTNLAANKNPPKTIGFFFIGLKNQGRFQNTHDFFGPKKDPKSSHTLADERLTPKVRSAKPYYCHIEFIFDIFSVRQIMGALETTLISPANKNPPKSFGFFLVATITFGRIGFGCFFFRPTL